MQPGFSQWGPQPPADTRDVRQDAIARFLADPDVKTSLVAGVPHGLAVGTRLKRTRKGCNKNRKKFDYGIVVYVASDKASAAALWMQDEKKLPVEPFHGIPGLNTLNSYRTAFDETFKKAPNRPIPQNATYEQLHHAWCA